MLTRTQLEDLAQLHGIARQFSADVAIIGAIALRCYLDIAGFTKDIDLVVALDLEDFKAFSDELKTLGWIQEKGMEHRWRGPGGSIIDLLPAGPGLRREKRIVWPQSEFVMSLVGFEHIFALAQPYAFAAGVQYRVAPLPVIALLKIIAFMDDPHRRRKDLLHITEMFQRYEAASDRLYSDDVFSAELQDFEYANALLLGMDVGAIATDEEVEVLRAFFQAQRISDEDLQELDREDLQERHTLRFQQQLRAFWQGINRRANELGD